jgi:hypothetical protein
VRVGGGRKSFSVTCERGGEGAERGDAHRFIQPVGVQTHRQL